MDSLMKRSRWLVVVAILTVLIGCGEPQTVFVVVTATPEPATPTSAPPLAASITPVPPTIAPTQTRLPPTAPPTVPPTAVPPTRTPPPPPQITPPPPPATPPPATPTRTPPPPPKVTGPPPPIIITPNLPTRTPTRPAGPPQIPSRFPPDGTFDSQGRTELDVWVVDAGYAANGMTQLTFEVMARVRGAQRNGDGIDNVEFLINRALPGGLVEEVYIHTENTAPYCAFQESSGTTCRRLAAQAGTLWRASDDNVIPRRPIMRGPHTLQVNVTGKKGERWQRLYEFTIR